MLRNEDDYDDHVEVEDRLAIEDLLKGYVEAIDTQDWPLYESVFTEDALIDYGRASGTKGNVISTRKWLEDALSEDRVITTHHLLANIRIRTRGDDAIGSAYFFNPDVRKGPDPSEGILAFNGGTYRFCLQRTGGRWLISELEAVVAWSLDPT